MVFEQEKVSHNQESDSDMRENENHHRSVCRLRTQSRLCDVEKINRGESRKTHKNPSGQGLSRHCQTTQKQRDSEEKDEKTPAYQRGEGE